MAFLHTPPVSLVATVGSGDIDVADREARQRAIQKFLARAEISKVSVILRWVLSMERVQSPVMIRVSSHV
jgi:hypothetical protein